MPELGDFSDRIALGRIIIEAMEKGDVEAIAKLYRLDVKQICRRKDNSGWYAVCVAVRWVRDKTTDQQYSDLNCQNE